MVVATALQSLSFPTSIATESCSKKAELVRLFYSLDWSDDSRLTGQVDVSTNLKSFDANVSAAAELVHLIYLIR